ncbi:hypothetical protein OH76DRAFT_285499 [Lentinus brumalis]|uniref:SHSP domain-containing protein n=1 Tax=Lentinus brumalis TaxID=2498619 RepID=A0A371CKK4_9APHY|nr:hypothetical protein OH76DRAFT_285499 [Polyporus brumalis]
MSPQYTTLSAYPNFRAASTKVQKLMQAQKEDPRYRDLDRMLARAYLELQRQRMQQKRSGVFMPRMDMYDDPANPHITAMLEVPGMKAEHLSVRIEHGRLIVEGERTGPHLHIGGSASANSSSEPSADAEAETATLALYPVRELKYGKFRREITLPAGVNAVHVRSILVEGMLTISWPRDPASLAVEQQPAAHHPSHTHTTTLHPSNITSGM